jgi:transporter family-2 protein
MLASVALDHFGWVGFPQHSATLPRLLGALFIVVGVALIRK